MKRAKSPARSVSSGNRTPLSPALSATQIMKKREEERQMFKESMVKEEKSFRMLKQQEKKARTSKWKKKTLVSPFRVDLVAEVEKMDEENRVRLREQTKRQKQMEKKRQLLKNQVIIQALSEASELDSLRREKRAIVEEERRLKALLDLEKTNSHRKQDLQAAQRAERNRKALQAEKERRERRMIQLELEQRKKLILKDKLGVVEPPKDTFTSFGN